MGFVMSPTQPVLLAEAQAHYVLTLILRRLFASLFVLLGVLIFTFAMLHLAPGDPASILASQNLSRSDIGSLRKQLGLDEPLLLQFFHYTVNLLQGDFGVSLYTHEPVGRLLLDRLPVTLALSFGALVISVAIGIPAGIFAARHRGTPLDYGVTSLAVLGYTVPVFWLGILLIIVFSIELGVLPVSGYVPLSAGVGNYLSHMALPWFALALESIGLFARMTRTALIEEMGQPYIRTAYSKGLSTWRVTRRHALPNAGLTLVTVIGLQLGTLLGGAVLTENVFALPGLGRLIVRSIQFRDYPVVQGALIVVAFMFILVNLIVDVLYNYLDPRVQAT
jgi:peptide/nickel transport system permease protein